MDDFNCEALRVEIDTSLPSGRVIRALNELIEVRGKPSGCVWTMPELISNALAQWARENLIELCFIQPGKPTQNALIEGFNRTMRTEVLDRYAEEPARSNTRVPGPPAQSSKLAAWSLVSVRRNRNRWSVAYR